MGEGALEVTERGLAGPRGGVAVPESGRLRRSPACRGGGVTAPLFKSAF
jgi:hypothetical protein